MAYAIMRCKKLTKMGNVAASLQHCFRERETLNADSERTQNNLHLSATSTDQAMGKLREMLPEKRRKDAVLAVEYVMTASPEWWQTATDSQKKDFFDRSMKWLSDKYGKDRIFTASIHLDEATPHLSAFVVPLTQDGRLSAKEFIGNKKQMQEDQTTFAKAVQDLGLERGIQGSKSTHERVKSFYGAISEEREPYIHISEEDLQPKVLKKGLFSKEVETTSAIANRITDKIKVEYKDTVKTAIFARTAQKKKQEAENTSRDLSRRLRPILGRLGEMTQATKELFAKSVTSVADNLIQEQKNREIFEREQARIERELRKTKKSFSQSKQRKRDDGIEM